MRMRWQPLIGVNRPAPPSRRPRGLPAQGLSKRPTPAAVINRGGLENAQSSSCQSPGRRAGWNRPRSHRSSQPRPQMPEQPRDCRGSRPLDCEVRGLNTVPRRHEGEATRRSPRPVDARRGSACARRKRSYLMNPWDRIHASATARGFCPSTLTSLFRARSVSVLSLLAIGLNSPSRPGYFLATSLRTERAGL
jgi:hypothetical protein